MFSVDTAALGKRRRGCDPGQPRRAIVPVMEGTVRSEIWAAWLAFLFEGNRKKNNPQPRRKVKPPFSYYLHLCLLVDHFFPARLRSFY